MGRDVSVVEKQIPQLRAAHFAQNDTGNYAAAATWEINSGGLAALRQRLVDDELGEAEDL